VRSEQLDFHCNVELAMCERSRFKRPDFRFNDEAYQFELATRPPAKISLPDNNYLESTRSEYT